MKRPPPVALRAVEVDDASVIQSWFDDEGFRQIAGARYPASVQHWREWAERNKRPEFDNATFAIYPADEDILIGVGSLRHVSAEDRSAEIGIFIGFAEHRRRGYGFSATRQLLHFGFSVMGLHRIYCRMLSHNRPGMGLVAACGGVHEGTAREAKFIDGKFHDVENFAVLATESTLERTRTAPDGEPAGWPADVKSNETVGRRSVGRDGRVDPQGLG